MTFSLHIFVAVDLLQILTKMRAVDLLKYMPLHGVFWAVDLSPGKLLFTVVTHKKIEGVVWYGEVFGIEPHPIINVEK